MSDLDCSYRMAHEHMAHGTWHMAHGTWHMAHGTWHMAHDHGRRLGSLLLVATEDLPTNFSGESLTVYAFVSNLKQDLID